MSFDLEQFLIMFMTYLIPSCDDYVFTVHCTILEACHWSILGKAYQEMIAAAARQGVALLELISAEEHQD